MGWVILVIVVLAVVSSLGNTAKRRQARRGMSMAQTPQQMLPGQPITQQMPLGPFPPGNAQVNSPGNAPTYQPVDPVGTWPTVIPPAPPLAPIQAPIQAPMVEGGDGAQPRQTVPKARYRPPSGAGGQPTRYQGSTALAGSSLSTTLATPYQPSSLLTSLSSSLSSSSTDSAPTTGSSSVFGAVSAIPLPDNIATQVRFHLRNGHEVEAVRLVCDQLDVGLLEATKTVRSYGDGSRS